MKNVISIWIIFRTWEKIPITILFETINRNNNYYHKLHLLRLFTSPEK